MLHYNLHSHSTIPTTARAYFNEENRTYTLITILIGILSITSVVLSIWALVDNRNKLDTRKRPGKTILSKGLITSKPNPQEKGSTSCTTVGELPRCEKAQDSSGELAIRTLDSQMEDVGSMVLKLNRDVGYIQDQLRVTQENQLPGLVLFALREKPVNFRVLLDELHDSKTYPEQFRIEYELRFSQSVQSLNWTVQDLTGTEARKLENWSADRKQVLVSWEYPNTKLPTALSRRFSLNLRGPTRVEEFSGWLWELGSSTPTYSSYHEFEVCKLPWSVTSHPGKLHEELQANQKGNEPLSFVLYVSDRNNDYCRYYEQLACVVPEFRQLHQDMRMIKIERDLIPAQWELPISQSSYPPSWYACSASSSVVTVTGAYTGKLIDEFSSMIRQWQN